MALGDRKSSDVFNTRTGGSKDSKSIDETDKTRIETAFDNGDHINDLGMFENLAPALYAIQQLSEDIEELRRYVAAEITSITSAQTSAITANTAKTGITSSQASAISNALPKSGGTMTGTLTGANIYADLFLQKPSGKPRNNLGDPTVTEIALFEEQFGPKTTLANDYDDLSDLTFWGQETSSSSWVEITSHSDDQKRKFLRTNDSSVIIPNTYYKFRVEFTAKSYTFANAMYMYWSGNSHNTQVHIWKKRCSDGTWLQHTSETNTISSWPGHGWLPFSNIAWHETNTTSTGHYTDIRVEFTPNWSTGSNGYRDINLYGMQIWGGYPKGRRTPHYYDQNGEFNFLKDAHLQDGKVLKLGTGNDLKLYHDGSNSYIDESGTGILIIKASNSLALRSATDENYIYCTSDGNVRLYYNNSQKLETASAGVNITGNLAVTGTIDSRDVAADGTKLDTIATNADVTPSWVPSSDPRYGTSNLALGTTSTTALAGDTVTITTAQAAILTNLANLPTSRGASGTFWNNRGMLSVS